MPYAAALSEHPLATHAVGEVIGQLIEELGTDPDLAVLFVTPPHAGALEDIAHAIRATLDPRCLVGAAAVSVIGGPREVEEQPAVSVWAARFSGEQVVTPIRLDPGDQPGVPLPPAGGEDDLLVLLADPFSSPVDGLLGEVSGRRPGLAVVGGLASASVQPGGNRLVLDERVFTDGAVGVHLAGLGAVSTVVSQGCRPIGHPFVITDAEGNVIRQLAGKPALERLQELVGLLTADERVLVQHGLQIGCVIDERAEEFTRGDFLVRAVLGADRESGAIAIGEEVEVGETVQFQVRDAATADEDLRELLGDQRGAGALLFTCNGRGRRLFGEPDHDAALVDAVVGGHATGGMFCAGELGPVGGRNFVHGFTASVALFADG